MAEGHRTRRRGRGASTGFDVATGSGRGMPRPYESSTGSESRSASARESWQASCRAAYLSRARIQNPETRESATPMSQHPFVRFAAAASVAALAACATALRTSMDEGDASAAGEIPPSAAAPAAQERWGMVIHGGAGTIRREDLTPEREAEYRAALTQALMAGHAILQRGGTSLDAVEAAINVMEDSPLFNAGRGAVLTADGRAELDAAVMDGATLAAGSVAGLHRVKNPIDLARAVMEKSPHVMMIGDGAEAFAREQGITLVEPEYFITEGRRRSWERMRQQDSLRADSARRARGGTAYSVPD